MVQTYVCRKEKSDYNIVKGKYGVYKDAFVPYLKIGRRLIQPKYASLGEKEEYPTKKSCERRIKTLNRR